MSVRLHCHRSPWVLFTLLLLHVFDVEAQEVQFELEVRLQSYQNPLHGTADGNCCAGREMVGSCRIDRSCNNQFTFCAGPRGPETSLSEDRCPYGVHTFRSNSDGITFAEGASIVEGSPVPNPIAFHGRGLWTGGFQLDIEINDINRNNPDELVDRFTDQQDRNPSDSFTSEITIFGNFSRGTFTLRYQVRCASNYFGSDCNTRCVPTERFTCDGNGNIVCRAGYQSEATNCSSCVPATGCDPNQGYCTMPGECVCLPGFTGNLCETAMNGNGIATTQETRVGEIMPTSNSPVGGTGNGNSSQGARANETTTAESSVGSGGRAQGGLSSSGVAGVVVGTILFLALALVGVAVGIVFWVYQPWSNGWFGMEKSIRKKWAEDAIDNPVYQEAEMSQYEPSPVRGVKYTPTTSTEVDTRGFVHSTEGSIDDDNPLYASSALEKILNPGEGDAAAAKVATTTMMLEPHQTNGRASNGHVQANRTNVPISTLRGSSSLEQILMTADVSNVTSQKESRPPPPAIPMKPRERMGDRRNSLPHGTPKEAVTSFLVASQSLDNLLRPNAKELDPYGEYGDKTMQRVASGNVASGEDEGGGRRKEEVARKQPLFDNPDYEFVDISGSSNGTDHPTDVDYEEI